MKTPIIYIAGSYRSKSINQIYENIQLARKAAIELAKNDIFFLCPHLNSGFMDGANSDEYFLSLGLELLTRCDYLLLIGDWRKSDGSCMEREMALNLGIPVFEDIKKLAKEIKKKTDAI